MHREAHGAKVVSGFRTPLRAELLDGSDAGRERWRLLEPLGYVSALVGDLGVPAGFISDGESVPRLVSGFAGPPCRRSGTLHDWIYQSHCLPRSTGDFVYREALLSEGLDPVWAEQRYAAVDFYGQAAYASGPSRLRIA